MASPFLSCAQDHRLNRFQTCTSLSSQQSPSPFPRHTKTTAHTAIHDSQARQRGERAKASHAVIIPAKSCLTLVSSPSPAPIFTVCIFEPVNALPDWLNLRPNLVSVSLCERMQIIDYLSMIVADWVIPRPPSNTLFLQGSSTARPASERPRIMGGSRSRNAHALSFVCCLFCPPCSPISLCPPVALSVCWPVLTLHPTIASCATLACRTEQTSSAIVAARHFGQGSGGRGDARDASRGRILLSDVVMST